ncbi:LPS export ABC transporter periplasmic protein LptC [Phenylobacterium sp.]|uniref:LPS export ABC transporter periplasmic protein LptC n=1 Tax=Phenylobacterium sp. TaxID=1871053 RepID=UPI002F95BED9
MSAAEFTVVAAPLRQRGVERWRRRSRLVRTLRLVLPALIVLILGGLAGVVVYNSVTAAPQQQAEDDAPIRLVNPRFVGRDDKGRAYVITAASAVRDASDYQRVMLDRPALVLDEEGPDPLRIEARQGVYHEGTRKLDLQGGVKLAGAQGIFETAASLFDTKSGEIVGSGPIHGSGSVGEITAKSYAVQGKGERMIFKGGVKTRLNTN